MQMKSLSKSITVAILSTTLSLLSTTLLAQTTVKTDKTFQDVCNKTWMERAGTASDQVAFKSFGDGPNPTYTPQILAILKKYNVKATFFVVGMNIEKHPELLKAIHDGGHVVANHSQSHPMLTKVSEAQLQNEVAKPSETIERLIGLKPKCLRYPFNTSNQHVRDVIREHNMQPISIGFNSFDYKKPGVDKIINRIISHLSEKQVILMHDGFADREQTVAALPAIIEGIQKKGLGFSTICG